MTGIFCQSGLISGALLCLSLLFNAGIARGSVDGPFGPWEDQDLGATGIAGSAAYTNGTFVVGGSGTR